jgi:hypothetical protein
MAFIQTSNLAKLRCTKAVSLKPPLSGHMSVAQSPLHLGSLESLWFYSQCCKLCDGELLALESQFARIFSVSLAEYRIKIET